jgi:CRP-like cAMP-binding protein
MITERFLRHRRGAALTEDERARLDSSVSRVVSLDGRVTMVRAGESLSHSTLLIDGFMCRYIDDRQGLRQLVAVHVPGDFVDLHAYPLKSLDHEVATLTAVTIAQVPHRALDAIVDDLPQLARKLWYSTLLDAAMHRAWLFRLGRLDAPGRIAHFLCETSARLQTVGLSDGRNFTLGLNQSDIAEVCGLTNVHVNRVLRTLREKGLCSVRSSRVEIFDPAGLARLGQFDATYLYLSEDIGAELEGQMA